MPGQEAAGKGQDGGHNPNQNEQSNEPQNNHHLALTMISISSCGFRHSPAVSVHICVLQECGWVQ